MYGTHSICNADSDPYVSARRWHLLRHNVQRGIAYGYHDGSGVSPASHMVSQSRIIVAQGVELIIFSYIFRIEAVQMIFVIIAAGMAALGFMILFVGFLATGATRYKVYRAWRSRVGGRISCAVLMGITYLLNFVWTLILCFLVIVTFIYTMFWNMCSSGEQSLSCIDLTQFRKSIPKIL